MGRLHRAWLPLATGLAILLADQATKEWAMRALAPVLYGPRVRVMPGLDFMLAYNTGGAFSIFHDKPWLITAMAAVITVGIVIWATLFIRNQDPDVPAARFAFGLILGGAIGNLVDRVRYQFVVDFIHAYIRIDGEERAWPTFNIADAAIVAGIGLFLYLSIFTSKLDPEKAVVVSPAEGAVSEEKPSNMSA